MAERDEKGQMPEEQAEKTRPVSEDTEAAPAETEFEEQEQEEPEEELTEEELRRIIEEQLERVTVAQMVQQMMITLASIGYQKMGLPEEVNLKYRDLDQARLAVDSLDGLVKAAGGKLPDEQVDPFRGTLANLKLNYVSISAKVKGETPETPREPGGNGGNTDDAESAG